MAAGERMKEGETQAYRAYGDDKKQIFHVVRDIPSLHTQGAKDNINSLLLYNNKYKTSSREMLYLKSPTF